MILVENLPVPRDRRVWMEATSLVQAGYRVSVISPCPEDDLDNPTRIIDGVHVYRYVMPPPTRSKMSFIYEFWYCLWETRRLVKEISRTSSIDVIQTCNPPDTFWWIARPYKRRGVKFVFDHHDLCPELYESKFGRKDVLHRALQWLEKMQFRTADAVIATNESYRAIAMGRGGKRAEDVVVVRSAPRKSKFVRRDPKPDLKKGSRYLGVYVGVMGVQDGIDYALRAIRSAIDQGLENTHFIFVGNGDAKGDSIELTGRLGLGRWVEFTGYVNDERLLDILSTADIGLAPDPFDPLNNYCTMNKIVEYMAMGVPIVSFDLEESRVSARDAAVFVPNNDEAAFGRAMIDLLQDEPRRQRMKEYGQRRFEQELCWEISESQLLCFYDRMCKDR